MARRSEQEYSEVLENVIADLRVGFSAQELAERYNVDRRTVYTWLGIIQEKGFVIGKVGITQDAPWVILQEPGETKSNSNLRKIIVRLKGRGHGVKKK